MEERLKNLNSGQTPRPKNLNKAKLRTKGEIPLPVNPDKTGSE